MAIFRILFVSSIILVGLVASFRAPLNALLFYLWIAYFRPDIWVENRFLLSLRFSLLVGILLLVITFIKGVKFKFTPFAALLSLVAVHSLTSSLLSKYSAGWVDFFKIIVISYLITQIIKTEKDLKMTLMVITLSLGVFDGAKQGWTFLILYPGRKNFNELPTLGDNNHVAVAMLLLVPVLIALSQTAERKIVKYGYIFIAIGVIYRALSTYSRGGFLTLLVICFIFWLRSRYKVRVLLIAVLLAAVILPTFPQRFWDRMDTITYSRDEQDASVQGRLILWEIAWTMAKQNPIFGIGHNGFKRAYLNFDEDHNKSIAVHSAWFGILSEWGFPGLIIFFSFYFYSVISCAKVRKKCKNRPELKSLLIYSNSIETSIIAGAAGITFLAFHYQEIIWHYFALAAVTHQIIRDLDAGGNKESIPKAVVDME